MRKRFFFRLQRLGLVQKIGKFKWTDCEKNAKNLHFLAFWAKMANFEQFLAKMGKTGIFFKKALGTFFSRLQALTNCKVSEKSNERFPRKRVTNERTNERTYGRTNTTPKVSNDFVERPKKIKT